MSLGGTPGLAGDAMLLTLSNTGLLKMMLVGNANCNKCRTRRARLLVFKFDGTVYEVCCLFLLVLTTHQAVTDRCGRCCHWGGSSADPFLFDLG